MSLTFDDASADSLIRAARAAEGRLRDEGIPVRGAVETAMEDFSGAYAELLSTTAGVESSDRGRLAGVMDDLASQVEAARSKAAEERDRRRRLADWRKREADRDRRRRNGLPDSVGADVDAIFDPKPSEIPVAPPTITATFSAQQRRRTSAGGRGSEKSSADPDHLSTFVSQVRASTSHLDDHLGRVRARWSAFLDSCSWVPIGSATFLGGFDRYLNENRSDATWIDRVAHAFVAAGGGSLSNRALNFAAITPSTMGDEELLQALASLPADEMAAMLTATPALQSQLQRMHPATVNTWWTTMNPPLDDTAAFSDQQLSLLETFPVLFGNLEGIPYMARDHANRFHLTATIDQLEARIAELQAGIGKPTITDGPVPSGFVDTKRLLDMREQLEALRNIKKALTNLKGDAPRYLISLTDDQQPLAAVSIGNLDTATSITYAIPGLDTTTKGMTGWTNAAQNLHWLLPPDSAVVAWIGYETPQSALLNVFNSTRAVSGGNNLARALQGLTATRTGAPPELNIVAHSYGTTTAAIALTHPDIRVKNLIMLGSAGLPDNIRTATDLNADNVYAGHARETLPWETESGDQWAGTGRDFSTDHHTNPTSQGFEGAIFGVDTGGDSGRPVTDHSALMGDGDEAGYLDWGTESLENAARAIAGNTKDITAHKPLGPTNYQQGLMTGGTRGF